MDSTAEDLVVVATSLSKRFATRLAVDAIDLAVPAGICFGLLGPNGAGKTTTMRMLYGVTRPTGGTIRVFGMDIGDNRRAVRARLGVTLQDTVLIEELTPRENLRMFGHYHLLGEPELSRRVEHLIAFLELGSHADVPARELSGGFKRRLAIAQSLVNQPQLLVLDEPTTGLDPAVRLSIWSRIRELRAQGRTVLLSTHYMDEAQRLCDRVAIMSQGRIVDEDTPRALIDRHLARETVELDCTVDEQPSLLDGLTPPHRDLRIGRRLMLYVDDASPFVDRIRAIDHGDRREMVVRPTNLEDVFLAVTGTHLEGGA